MAPRSSPPRSDPEEGGAATDSAGRTDLAREPPRVSTDPRVLLFMGSGRDRELLAETLGERYRVETTTDVEALESGFDCCVFDARQFNRVAGTVQSRRDTAAPVFLPFVLLVGEDASDAAVGEAWEYVDDVIELPVRKATLHARIGNLIQRRRTAAELANRERQLGRTVDDLRLKERAMDEAPIGITITGTDEDDYSMLYVNEQFEEMTGYDEGMLGENCRFLQGEETDPETRATIREALDEERPVSVDILNYRRDGATFWNKLDIAPIRDGEGSVTNYVGFQTDITERKVRERRLDVLNRVLSHNLRNTMSVISGHVALLRDDYDEEPPESLSAIEEATADLMGLAESVRKIERTMSQPSGEPVAIDERIEMILGGFTDRFPEATFEVVRRDEGPYEVAVPGLGAALEEAIENAVKHNDCESPSVEVRVGRPSPDWVEIEIEDDGPGIPDREIEVLDRGETALNHADRLGLWLIHWVVNRAGGDLSVREADASGAVVTLSVPTTAPGERE